MNTAKIILLIGFMVTGYAGVAAQKQTNGDRTAARAWQNLNQVAVQLKSSNVRAACRAFGKYEVLKAEALADDSTNPWDQRNLNFNDDDIMSRFCSETVNTPNGVSLEEAIQSAERNSDNIGLESVGK